MDNLSDHQETTGQNPTLEIKYPWTMLPMSVADGYIEYLNEKIDEDHPLYGREVFPSCIRVDNRD